MISSFATPLRSRLPVLTCAGIAGILLFTPVSSRAVIGETRQELSKRYGAGKDVGAQMLYTVDNLYSLSVYFGGEKSTMDVYGRMPDVDGTHEDLTADDIQKLLDLEGGGGTWNKLVTKSGLPTWRSSNGQIIARMSNHGKTMVFLDAGLK